MIQLTNQIIAVEVPNDAEELNIVSYKNKEYLVYFSSNGHILCRKKLTDSKIVISLIGVTPLSEEQWKEIVGNHTSSEKMYCNRTPYIIPVSPKDRWNDLQRHKGLDINKKYAIIKIEK